MYLFRLTKRFTIIERGYVNLLQLLLQRYPKIIHESCDQDQQSGLRPLTVAALFDQTECIQLLLVHGADVNERDAKTGYTPIMCAASHTKIDHFQLILSYHPDIRLTSLQGRKLMYIIMELGLVDYLALLVESYPDLDINEVIGENNVTAVHVACMYHQAAILPILFERRIDLTRKTIDGLDVFQICDMYSALQCKQMLLHFSSIH